MSREITKEEQEKIKRLLLANFLYDASVRRQIYLEGLKAWQADKYDSVIAAVMDIVARELAKLKAKSLGDFTKAQFMQFRAKVLQETEKKTVAYVGTLTADLIDFLQADVELAHTIYDKDNSYGLGIGFASGVTLSSQNNANGNAVLWASIRNGFIPASGLTLAGTLAGLISGASAKINRIITIAYADGTKTPDVLDEVSRAGATMMNGGRGVISTAYQHVGSQAQEAVASTIYGAYVWTSVIDSRTTEICRSRNMNVYQYGRGPIPPAHYGCRSITVPVVEGVAHTKQSYYAWLQSQPEEVQDDILGRKRARDLRSGLLKSDDLDRFDGAVELTLEQYSGKAGFILRRKQDQ